VERILGRVGETLFVPQEERREVTARHDAERPAGRDRGGAHGAIDGEVAQALRIGSVQAARVRYGS